MSQKLKVADMAGFDPEELDVEWEDSDFESYDGEQPPTGTILRGYFKKAWWTYTKDDTPMIKVLWVAADNTGKLEEYNGLPIWDQLVFKTSAAFRYGPWLQITGVTLKQIHKNTTLADDDDNVGAPIEKIAKWAPGEDAEASVITKRVKYQGEWKVEVGKYVDPDAADDDDDDDEEEDEEETKPTRRGRSTKAAEKPAAKSTKSRRKPDPEPEDDDDDEEDDDDVDDDEDVEDDDDVEEEPPAKPARRTSRTAAKPAAKTAAKRTPAKAATKTTARKRKSADDDDDPF
jgi:hypothetical protein